MHLQETIPDLELQLKSLIKTRKELIDTIQSLSKKRHYLLVESPQKKVEEEKIAGDQPRKMVKKDSSFKEKLLLKDKQIKKEQEDDENEVVSPSNKKESHVDDKTHKVGENIERNRRFFGGLSIHLKKAKSNIEAEKEKTNEKNRVLQKVLQKKKQKDEELLKEEIEKIDNQVNKAEKEKNENAKQILKIQNLLLLSKYQTYAGQLKKFIFTKTEPSISWQPAKEFDMARKLLDEKQKEIDAKSNQICQSIKNYQEKFDYSLYLLQNEQEYYKGVLDHYFRSQQSFFITKTEPHLSWKPTHLTESMKTINHESQNILSEKKAKLKTLWDEHYKSELQKLKLRTTNPKSYEPSEESQSEESFHKEEEEDE